MHFVDPRCAGRVSTFSASTLLAVEQAQLPHRPAALRGGEFEEVLCASGIAQIKANGRVIAVCGPAITWGK